MVAFTQRSRRIRWVLIALLVCALAVASWAVQVHLSSAGREVPSRGSRGPAPVEIAAVERGPIEWRRTVSGALEARAEFVVAPKVAGRVERLFVDLADVVRRGQLVAQLDDDEYLQAVAQARADLAVINASVAEAKSVLEIAEREFNRVKGLHDSGVVSASELDTARATYLAKKTAVTVAEAQAIRGHASLTTARIRHGYTGVVANWSGPDNQRVVGERFVTEGDTVSANAPLVSIVALDPITAVVFATETEYAQLTPGQPVALAADAHPGRVFSGKVVRIAPVFQRASRQARVEIEVENRDHDLKPGMFVRATVVLGRADDATIVPVQALVTREGQTGVFVVDAPDATVTWRPVKVGIRDGDRVQVSGAGIAGSVVTLGQQLIDDGAAIAIPSSFAAGRRAKKP